MDINLAHAIDRFLEHCRIAKRLSPNTLRAYETDLADFASHVGTEGSAVSIGKDALLGYARSLFDERGLKETTVKRRIAALKVMFKWLERDQTIPLSPFHRFDFAIRLPRRLPRALTAEEMRRLLEGAEMEAQSSNGHCRYSAVMLHFVVICLFTTGLRVGELVGVRMVDVDAFEAMIQVRGKGDRERRVYLAGGCAIAALNRYLAERRRWVSESEALLITTAGAPATAQMLRRAVVALGKRAGVARRVTPHMLRHTAATQLIEAGIDIRPRRSTSSYHGTGRRQPVRRRWRREGPDVVRHREGRHHGDLPALHRRGAEAKVLAGHSAHPVQLSCRHPRQVAREPLSVRPALSIRLSRQPG